MFAKQELQPSVWNDWRDFHVAVKKFWATLWAMNSTFKDMPGHLNLIKVQTDDARQSFQAGVYQVTVLLHNPSTFELSSTGFSGREQNPWFKVLKQQLHAMQTTNTMFDCWYNVILMKYC